MSSIVFFDMKRTTTAISSTGKVHISWYSGAETLCGLNIEPDYKNNWSENLNDRQPSCVHCLRIAYKMPSVYHFTRRVTPL